MAIEAPSHGQRRARAHQRHLTHGAVAGGAAYALGDVNRMIEIDVIGQPVHLVPANGLVVGEAAAHPLQHFGLCIELRMASHAGMGGGNTRNGRPLDSGMTISAINAEPADMMLVAERNRLTQRDVLIRGV